MSNTLDLITPQSESRVWHIIENRQLGSAGHVDSWKGQTMITQFAPQAVHITSCQLELSP